MKQRAGWDLGNWERSPFRKKKCEGDYFRFEFIMYIVFFSFKAPACSRVSSLHYSCFVCLLYGLSTLLDFKSTETKAVPPACP